MYVVVRTSDISIDCCFTGFIYKIMKILKAVITKINCKADQDQKKL